LFTAVVMASGSTIQPHASARPAAILTPGGLDSRYDRYLQRPSWGHRPAGRRPTRAPPAGASRPAGSGTPSPLHLAAIAPPPRPMRSCRCPASRLLVSGQDGLWRCRGEGPVNSRPPPGGAAS
jgi:hypothetical protein